ncbi:hypothetical protein HBNXHx_1585 [Haloferax volcanii]|nr:hypothetical protein HBNXHx_1585 [Haloferax alexandrinus]
MKSLASGRLSDFDANRPGSTGPRISRARSNPRTRIAYSEIQYTSLESDKPPATEAFRESGIESR